MREELVLQNRIKDARTQAGMSQAQLAELVGVSRNTISSIETGQFSPTAKLALIARAKETGIPILCCLGTGNKLDPTKFVVTDLAKTDTCPLARVLRQRLRKKGIDHLQVVYSTEPAMTPLETIADGGRRQVPGSLPFVPPVAGIMLAREAVLEIIK